MSRFNVYLINLTTMCIPTVYLIQSDIQDLIYAYPSKVLLFVGTKFRFRAWLCELQKRVHSTRSRM